MKQEIRRGWEKTPFSALKDCGKTVIVVSHDDKFREISDNVIFLRP
ncbi:hypothetical protein [Ligilactobacillus ruminis]|nr:hypothetical protein [Ligilactobacillus ruminis]